MNDEPMYGGLIDLRTILQILVFVVLPILLLIGIAHYFDEATHSDDFVLNIVKMNCENENKLNIHYLDRTYNITVTCKKIGGDTNKPEGSG